MYLTTASLSFVPCPIGDGILAVILDLYYIKYPFGGLMQKDFPPSLSLEGYFCRAE
jgi:hypothetical protein